MIYKRKKQGKTDYKKRIELLKSNKPRLVIRKTTKNIIAQIIEFKLDGDKVLVSAHTNELKKKFNWQYSKKNIPSAYLLGLLIGTKAKKKNIKEVIADIGLRTSVKGATIYAVIKGVLDANLNIKCSKKILPSEERIKGQHIVKYAEKNKEKFTKSKPENLITDFEEVKSKILK